MPCGAMQNDEGGVVGNARRRTCVTDGIKATFY